MNLFIETPRQASNRLERETRSQDAWVQSMQEQYDAQTHAAARQEYAAARQEHAVAQQTRGAARQGPGDENALGQRDAVRPLRAGEKCRREGKGSGRAASGTGEPYSVAQESYREELSFHRERARRRKLAAVARVLGFALLIPLALVAVFVGSYVLTCVVNGASPDEVLELVQTMPQRIESFVRTMTAM